MATATKLQRAFGTLFAPDVIKKWDDEEDQRKAAETLSEIIGKPSEEAFQLFESDPAETPGTGMYEGASPEMVTQLSQLQQMASSGNPMLQQKAMAQYDEFIKPPATKTSTQPNSYKEYLMTDPTPTGPEYNSFLMSGKKALGGIGDGALKLSEIAGLSIENAEGLRVPVDNPTLTPDDVKNNTGLPPGSRYVVNPSSAEADVRRARDATMLVVEQIDEALFTGESPIFGDDYSADPESQLKAGLSYITQDKPEYAAYVHFINGVAGQLARTVSGEKGALREEDIQRAIGGLLPIIAHVGPNGVPVKGDTKAVAEIKMRRLKQLLRMKPAEQAQEVEDKVQEKKARFRWDVKSQSLVPVE